MQPVVNCEANTLIPVNKGGEAMLVNAITDTGLVRKDNEDNYLTSAERGLFVVADGMGGHEAGEVASAIAIKTIDEMIQITDDFFPVEALMSSIKEANKKIWEKSHSHIECTGMGTTVTAALFQNDSLFIAHIGDSRAYLVNENGIRVLTQDHSLVGELIRNGGITEQEAQFHPRRNVLTRALGGAAEVEIDILEYDVKKGNILLLCTDGLYNHVDSKEMLESINKEDNLKNSAHFLVDLALDRGGTDNITVVLVEYV